MTQMLDLKKLCLPTVREQWSPSGCKRDLEISSTPSPKPSIFRSCVQEPHTGFMPYIPQSTFPLLTAVNFSLIQIPPLLENDMLYLFLQIYLLDKNLQNMYGVYFSLF